MIDLHFLISLKWQTTGYLTVHGLSLDPSQSPEYDQVPLDSAQDPPPAVGPLLDQIVQAFSSPAHNSA